MAIINEAAVARYWPGEDPIGKWITLDAASGERPRQVIGIVRNVPLRYLYPAEDPIVYTSYLQQDERYRGLFANTLFGQMTFLVRSAADPLAQTDAVRQAVADLEPGWPILNMDTMQRSVGVEVREIGLYTLAVSIFGIAAMLLAAIGVYGVTAYSVAQRTQEIGIRIALGATTSDIAYMISRNVLWVVGAGLASGLAASLASARLIGSQLWGVQPTDLSTFVCVSVIVASVALLAFFIPARRATLVNPADTLRNDVS